ncbi:hypothetical protein HDU96_008556 [Phlyctochytrium bullatum]|nr:hypothetical protein HDU96_008556 [Phlyctochytrium bullatum]
MKSTLATLLAALAATTAVTAAPQASQALIPTAPGLDFGADAEVQALCAASPKSKWEQHVCAAFGNVQRGCMPQRRFPYGKKNATEVKGAVLLFHGYTACPDAMEYLAARLQSEGFMTYTPLNPGHGMKSGDCNRTGAICLRDTPIDKLPTKKDQYIAFTQWAVDMLREELPLQLPAASRSKNFTVSVVGLSLGGPLAASALAQGNDLFNSGVLVNPFFSVAAEFLDIQVADCQKAKDPQDCIGKLIDKFTGLDAAFDANKPAPGPIGMGRVLKWLEGKALGVVSFVLDRVLGRMLLNHYSSLMRFLAQAFVKLEETAFVNENLDFLNGPFGWGDGCFLNTARAGYCIFQIRNLVALSSFGTYTLSRSQFVSNKKVALITTERDGYIRNGIAYAAASAYAANANSVSMCFYNREKSCSTEKLLDYANTGNTCGVPHSCFSRAENFYQPPFQMYWETNTFENVVRAVTGGSVGTPPVAAEAAGQLPVDQCEALELGNLLRYKALGKMEDASATIEYAIGKWSK